VLREDFSGAEGVNNYGMELVKMTAAEARAESAKGDEIV
jgi:hypothetical protein